MRGWSREKKYVERITTGSKTTEDSGTISFNGSYITANDGKYTEKFSDVPDPAFIGERPFRETPGGFYRDYDQFINGALGPTGTFIIGYLRIMGGKIEDETVVVDGHTCTVVRYPHIGDDQYCLFYLDPEIGWRPRKMVQYFNRSPYRVVDSYKYHDCGSGIHLPIHVKVTDYAVLGDHIGKTTARYKLNVDVSSLKITKR
jgi:hypothetical protein